MIPSPIRPILPTRLALCFALSLGISLGCGDARDGDSIRSERESSNEILATVDGTPIRAESVDLALRLDLHDLEHARYQRRLDRLRRLISQRLGPGLRPESSEWKQRVEIHLEAPTAPRLEIPDREAPIRGPETAPVTLSVFVDFESAHNRRLQPDLSRILDRFPEHVRLLVHDLPLPYHRFAWDAAYAAHCAAEQDAYWAYHETLLLEQPKLAPDALRRYAARLGLNPDRFGTCIDSGRASTRIKADVELAAALGIRRAATLFVNGLYLTDRPGYPEIERVVRSELARLGIDANPPTNADTKTPRARSRESDAREGMSSPGARANDHPPLPEVPADFLDDPEAVITLTRAEVDRALRDRQQLDRKLEASSAEFSGHRLLKIRTIAGEDFYARLGLEERDVLMIVNGEFLTVENDILWDAFEKGNQVKILVMRRGLPHTYEYRIR